MAAFFGAFVSVMVLSAIVIVGLYLFAAGYIRKFSTRARDLKD